MLIDNDIYNRILQKKKQLDKLRPFPKAALEKLKGFLVWNERVRSKIWKFEPKIFKKPLTYRIG